MKAASAIVKFLKNSFCYPKWRCASCGKEVFANENFCRECYAKLPFNDGHICEHCGRRVVADENYCSTCKGMLTNTDRARSVFLYKPPISNLVMRAKYFNAKYLLETFSEYLAAYYFKFYFNSDYLCYVPMTKKAENNRGYNQSKVLAEAVSEKTGVPVADVAVKIKETKKQASLNAKSRRENLTEAFKIIDKKTVKDKVLLIIDDVTTTGATGEALAEKLKKAGAKRVELLTIASVPPKDGY